MNWGTKIIISFILFAGFVFTLVFKMITSGNDLVSKDYYRSGEQVNNEINLQDLSNNIHQGFSIIPGDTSPTVRIQFRNLSERPEGKIILTCLSSENADQTENLALSYSESDSSWHQTIRPRHFASGNWLCEIRGTVGGKEFMIKDEFRVYKSSSLP